MHFGRIVSICLTATMAVFGMTVLAGCGPSSEEVVRQSVTDELESIKTLDSALLDELSADTSLEQLGVYGIDSKEFVSSYLSGFDYRVEQVTVDGKTAQATAVLTCKSFKEFESEFSTSLETLASDPAIPNMSDDEVNQKLGQTVMDTLASLNPVETAPIVLDFELKDNVWSPTASAEQAVSNALFGN